MATASTLNRRSFLRVGAAAGGGLLISGFVPGIDGALDETGRLEAAAGIFEPNIWVKIAADGTVTMTLTQLEMGQGVMTSMPMLVAEELDVDWNTIKLEWAPADAKYGNPDFGGQQLTAGSNSVRGMWKVLRQSGATARAMLITAGAQTWGVDENTVSTEKGEVVHRASGRRLKYGALVDRAAALPAPKVVALKDPKDFTVLGQSLPRLDIPLKVNGAAEFGLDVKRPDMLVARVVRCPVFGGKVASFTADRARAIPGVRHVVQISTGIAVAADNYWAASKGAQAIDVKWDEGPLAKLNSADITRKYAELAQQPGFGPRCIRAVAAEPLVMVTGDQEALFCRRARHHAHDRLEAVAQPPFRIGRAGIAEDGGAGPAAVAHGIDELGGFLDPAGIEHGAGMQEHQPG